MGKDFFGDLFCITGNFSEVPVNCPFAKWREWPRFFPGTLFMVLIVLQLELQPFPLRNKCQTNRIRN